MSQFSRKLLGSLTQDYLWMRTLMSQPKSKLTEKLTASAKAFQVASNVAVSSSGASSSVSFAPPAQGGRGPRGFASDSPMRSGSSVTKTRTNARTQEWKKAVNHLTDVAADQLAETTLLETKKHIFS